jgi:hypothetical protein
VASASANSPATAAGAAQQKGAKPPVPAPGAATTYQRLEVEGQTDPKVAKKPAPAPAQPQPRVLAPFATIPNIFR